MVETLSNFSSTTNTTVSGCCEPISSQNLTIFDQPSLFKPEPATMTDINSLALLLSRHHNQPTASLMNPVAMDQQLLTCKHFLPLLGILFFLMVVMGLVAILIKLYANKMKTDFMQRHLSYISCKSMSSPSSAINIYSPKTNFQGSRFDVWGSAKYLEESKLILLFYQNYILLYFILFFNRFSFIYMCNTLSNLKRNCEFSKKNIRIIYNSACYTV